MIEAPLLRCLKLSKVSEVACDASRVGVSDVISQDGHFVAYFSKKLNKTK